MNHHQAAASQDRHSHQMLKENKHHPYTETKTRAAG
jgi:hypothetical protein